MTDLLTENQSKILTIFVTTFCLLPRFVVPVLHKGKAKPRVVKDLTKEEKLELTLKILRYTYGTEEAVQVVMYKQAKNISKTYQRLLQLLETLRYMLSMCPDSFLVFYLLLFFLCQLLNLLKNGRLTREERESLIGIIIALIIWLMAVISPIFIPVILALFSCIIKELSFTAHPWYIDRV